jgi:MFS family permease
VSPTIASPAASEPADVATPAQRRGMRDAIIATAFGCLGSLTFGNGVLLLYLTKLDFGSASTLLILALPMIALPVLQMPAAYRADRRGVRGFVLLGNAVCVGGFAIVAAAGLLPGALAAPVAVVGIAIYAVGASLGNAAWFSMLSPLVPAGMRGGFFGSMRVTWQLTGLAFGVICTFALGRDTPLAVFVAILAVISAAMVVRVVYLARVPQLDAPRPHGQGLIAAVVAVSRAPGYASFCCYTFLLTLVTANAPTVFALLEKDAAGFGDRAVVWMGNLLAMGSVVGYFLGGRLIDRLGTKPMFLICHAGFALVFFAFLGRDLLPVPTAWWLGGLSVAYGVVAAASSIAISSEMLALIPPENKSVSTGLCTSLIGAGAGLAGVLNAGALSLGLFSPHWSLGGADRSAYDSLLLIDGILVLVLVVALGLVPSVIGKAAWAPKGV